jgi:hypothetical protein
MSIEPVVQCTDCTYFALERIDAFRLPGPTWAMPRDNPTVEFVAVERVVVGFHCFTKHVHGVAFEVRHEGIVQELSVLLVFAGRLVDMRRRLLCIYN